ncbi:lysostaphin resistance A-like protein [Corynebacterium flavescens]|uniref:lysostaphin resistance A-like protein n=1 Tax=Corynebacterium flavescens TaxID=28028 RepID=UPI003FD32DF6
MQRSNNQLRAAAVFSIAVMAAITAICLAFPLVNITLPGWLPMVGRWIPALISLAVIFAFRLPGGVLDWWSLRPGGARRLISGALISVAMLLVIYALAAALTATVGAGQLQPGEILLQILVLVIPSVLISSLSTFGEEVAWRGMLQKALAGWGFWRSSCAIAALWVAFHVPLHGVMAAQGTLPGTVALTSTLVLFPLGLFLSAVTIRFGSVWPAVFGHGLPLTALNLLVLGDPPASSTVWTASALSALLLFGGAYFFAPVVQTRRARVQGRPQVQRSESEERVDD